MTDIEIILTDLGEIATREIAKKRNVKGLKDNRKIAKLGGHTAKVARDELERNLGETVIRSENTLSYQYKNENLIENK